MIDHNRPLIPRLWQKLNNKRWHCLRSKSELMARASFFLHSELGWRGRPCESICKRLWQIWKCYWPGCLWKRICAVGCPIDFKIACARCAERVHGCGNAAKRRRIDAAIGRCPEGVLWAEWWRRGRVALPVQKTLRKDILQA